jgi:DNA-binding response OmpR family regulator
LNLPWIFVQQSPRAVTRGGALCAIKGLWELGNVRVQYLFEDYVLDTDRRELKRGSELIAIGPQVFDLLMYLLRNRERVVSKDDLLETI